LIDVAALRRDTPGTEHVVHLNNAGAALMPTPVVDAIRAYLDCETRNGGYEAQKMHADQVADTYGSIASLVNADPSEIAIMDSATRAWDMVLYSLPHRRGDRLLTTTTEYGSNWAAYLQLEQRFGIETIVVPDTDAGEIDVEALESLIDDRTTLITLNHMPTNNGVVNPVADVGVVAARHGVPYLLDACQTVGQMPIDVDAIGCDFLTATSRKYLRGPRGLGFAYVRTASLGLLDPVFVDNFSSDVTETEFEFLDGAARLETWEKSYANIVGLGAAVDYAMETGIGGIWSRIRGLAAYARSGLADINGVSLVDKGTEKGGIVTFVLDDIGAPEVQSALAERRINVSHSTVNSAPVDMRLRRLDDVVRASFHAYNTEEEIDLLVDAVRLLCLESTG
jgi:selenocysteine lyase/cysteine desulfurase